MKPPSNIVTIFSMFCLTAGLAAAFLLVPIVTRYETALANQAQWSADSDRRHQASVAASRQAAALATIRPDVVELLPTSDLQYDLIVQVESLAHLLSLPLTSLTVTGTTAAVAGAPATSGAPAGPPSVVLNVAISGTYTQIQQFIQTLPKMSRFITIGQLAVSTSTKDSGSAGTQAAQSAQGVASAITATLTANAYYFPSVAQKK